MAGMKTTLYLDPSDYQRLKMIARRRRQPPAALVREAVREYADRHAPARGPRSLGAGRSGMRSLGRRAEELLKGMGNRR
jgi:predicted transcriptional regulator